MCAAQIERRLAPFWKGLDDHSSSWTEHQLVAAARGLPIPAADEIPPEMARSGSSNPRGSDVNLNSLTVPITSRSQSFQSDKSANGRQEGSSASQLFRGRAKTLASFATGSKSSSPSGENGAPPELRLPNDPYVSGLPIEAYLYREPLECPICFLYYPPYLNQTRCCDQPMCSECFVQIKRPDPHPPEHEQPGQERPPEEEAEQLVSEVAACPFCKQPEFGITYDPPPFRRGLAYSKQPGNSTSIANNNNPLAQSNSPTSSQTSLPAAGRRRTTSISATASRVITTDRVRPDWAKKLSDARSHALRRGAAATALHNAAYMLGGAQNDSAASRTAFGRRRRTLFGESPGESGSGTPTGGEATSSAARGSRRAQVEDLENLMMVEAIRLSLAAEEERVRKASKGARKEGKKIAKEAKKEAKAADKAARKNSGPSASTSSSSLYPVGSNDSYASSSTSTAMARSTSNLGQQQASIAEVSEEMEGKGKAPAQDFGGYKPSQESTSTLNMEIRDNAGARHLEESRANLTGNQTQPQVRPVSPNPPVLPLPTPLHNLAPATSTSSGASSLTDRDDSAGHTPGLVAEPDSGTDTPPAEPNFNFRSLAAMIGEEDEIEGRSSSNKSEANGEHIEHAALPVPLQATTTTTLTPGRGRGDSGESSSSAPPPNYLSTTSIPDAKLDSEDDDDAIRPVPIQAVPNSNNASIEAKGALDVGVNERRWEATQ
jgi:hypothetical protein